MPRVRAVGETGLDRYRTGEDGWAAQEASFRAHIDIAKRHGIALVIHDLMSALGFERFAIHVNNRLVLNGLLASLGLSEQAAAVSQRL